MKLLIKKIIFLFKFYFNLDQLNSIEVSGRLSKYSKLKFLPKTTLSIPFYLGRTIRGISFQYLENVDLRGSKQDLIGKQFIDQLNDVSNEKVIKNLMFILKKEENLTAADIMNCPNNKFLKSYPAWASVFPWEKLSIQKKYHCYLESFINSRTKHGAKFSCTHANISKQEIYSYDVAISEVNQTEKLINSVRKNGIRKTNNLPRIYVLINKNGEWRWIMSTEGNHRSYLFYLNGAKNFSVIIEDVVYKDSLKSCYNVKNGAYSLIEAENIFDGIFSGNSYIRGII